MTFDTSTHCYWVHTQDGQTTLIPGCWARVHDPVAHCTCGKWSEETAAKCIHVYKQEVYHLHHQIQQLRQALARAGAADPTTPTDWRAVNAAAKRRAIHAAITEAGQ